ncbi:ornithine carbamoyltransferase [Tepidibacillus infernus]|uniref:Ornithine carbamoyltransferase n=1 Tax=Tepidibacillus decaturensis TaxID=1413211 RepID=A0A135L621_9BACI|nr:ornithine carbamoyltransferase [Tepidibacillus decaturensis]KXG44432.1 ornithine carbamoyltransferase [Tepidibacillus decaturensis]
MSIAKIEDQQPFDFNGRDFLTLADFSKEEIEYFILLGIDLKEKLKKGVPFKPLAGKTLGMIFEKSSTRTRVSFEVGMVQLGGYPLFLSKQDIQLGRGETIADTARVLSRYVDGIMMRTDSQQKLIEMARYSTIPIINGLSDLFHPTQAIADFMTIYEHKKKWQGLKLVYIGDGNNVAHSLMITGTKLGMDVVVASPKGYEPNAKVIQLAKEEANRHGGKLEVINDPQVAVIGADIIYTDVWTSMGQEQETRLRLEHFKGFQVNSQLLKAAEKDHLFMHCLPAHRGEEVTDEVIEGPNSVVFDEAENRLHAHKAILTAFIR